ncbi:alpha-1,6-mannosyltransferase subunit [Pholiota conissans]|uniref:Mannosyltransferase n=1 Tax=Pholiota conissans TaxID=109636 RepID=A0A9P6D6E7_9AGAR|nr:alpha-1,6-mannosyltransferase subunit [Pholiota conissans]
MPSMNVILDSLILFTGWAHVVLAPYTKVEESFNLHAVHDVIMYGVGAEGLPNYDHFVFPGAVPRTFVGSVLLAWLTKPVLRLATRLGYLSIKFDMQLLVRLVLATLNAATLCLIQRSTRRRFGLTASTFFTLFTCSQFHYPFWMGRTIPNMFATIPVNIATYILATRNYYYGRPSARSITGALSLVTFTAVVFRAEVALFLASLSMEILCHERITYTKLFKVGLVAGLLSIALTMYVDSYFWQRRWLWPEFSAVYFNVFQGKSADWGTSPWYTYFFLFLPKLLLGALPLSIVGFCIDQRIRTIIYPCLLFMFLISFLGHKEWRFIIYVVPVFNVAAAIGTKFLLYRWRHSWTGRLLALAITGIFCANFFATTLSIQSSMRNYPGGEALYLFHKLYPVDTYPTPHLYISNLAAQTGASLFLHLNSPPYGPFTPTSEQLNWTYNKTESLTPKTLSSYTSSITHIISETPPESDRYLDAQWHSVAVVRGFDRWKFDRTALKGKGDAAGKSLVTRLGDVLTIEESDKLWILERNGFKRIGF